MDDPAVKDCTISEISRFNEDLCRIKGWVYNKRSSGKIVFVIVRDGTGLIQAVASREDVGDEGVKLLDRLPQESSIVVVGKVREDKRAPGGYEIHLLDFRVVDEADPDYPITLKEHGVDFLLDHRHLWIRTPRQRAILTVRARFMAACREFLDKQGFIEVSAPILTPSVCEGTTTLFETRYFEDKAYLSQSGQLYMEAAAMALGRVYCFGPTFRAEKSKTRRHLAEFWMVEPEAAYMEFEDLLKFEEAMVSYVVARVLETCEKELREIGRDPEVLAKIVPPFPRMTYDEAVKALQEKGYEIAWGDDFGAPHESEISLMWDKPVFVTHYPKAIKAFYMQPDPSRDDVVLGADLLAPEGYGEITGGGQRIHDFDLLMDRIREHKLPVEDYQWYLDLRKYGSVPHSGFGMGIERAVAWICGLEHVRETAPFPRMLTRMRP
ncbi:MAG: asparagine--tRNA ligase [Firmicutes bacterium]|nr:asparagine--tRNA ligase [Candidatus Fermentithermobacillaceae bacterium]